MPSWRRSTISWKGTASPSSSARWLVAVAGLPLLYFLQFDFNPMNLRNPKVESIATFLDLRKDPNTGANAIDVMTTSEADAKDRRTSWPSCRKCARTMSLDTFVPDDQPAKLKLIAQGRQRRSIRALNPDSIEPRQPTPRMSRSLEGSGPEPAQDRRARPTAPGRDRLAAGSPTRCPSSPTPIRPPRDKVAGHLRHAAEDDARPAQELRCRRSRSA